MDKAIVLAVAASFCTATASVAQRQGARSIRTTGGFDARLIFQLARSPVWLLGIASMICGFIFPAHLPDRYIPKVVARD